MSVGQVEEQPLVVAYQREQGAEQVSSKNFVGFAGRVKFWCLVAEDTASSSAVAVFGQKLIASTGHFIAKSNSVASHLKARVGFLEAAFVSAFSTVFNLVFALGSTLAAGITFGQVGAFNRAFRRHWIHVGLGGVACAASALGVVSPYLSLGASIGGIGLVVGFVGSRLKKIFEQIDNKETQTPPVMESLAFVQGVAFERLQKLILRQGDWVDDLLKAFVHGSDKRAKIKECLNELASTKNANEFRRWKELIVTTMQGVGQKYDELRGKPVSPSSGLLGMK